MTITSNPRSAGHQRPSPAREAASLSLTAALGVRGWEHLDPVLLAALALEAPVLLVGEHGTAKTLLVERVATALDSAFRHYNAALVNYDDLVGIPLPDDAGGLRFVGTPGAVWGATFVFFDEVNRCRPDLQNKLFPIVHERRVAGVELPVLRHRWAAMNPPPVDEDPTDGYLGAEPLDTALADRFWFVVRVPGWAALSRSDREGLAAGIGSEAAGAEWLAGLVARLASDLNAVEAALTPTVAPYAVTLTELLRQGGTVLSPRRARMLVRSIAAVYVAADALARPLSLKAAAELTVSNALPQWADPEPPTMATVIGAHVQAWDVTVDELDPARRAVLEEPDPVRRIRLGLDLRVDEPTLARLVTSALAAQPSDAHRLGLATVLTRALSDHDLTPAAWSPLADWGRRALRPGTHTSQEAPGPRLEAWRRASALLADTHQSPLTPIQRAVVTACGPELLAGVDSDDFVATVDRHCQLFDVSG